MLRKSLFCILGVVFLIGVSGPALAAEQLTIFWAEWDPATYLQELVLGFEKETGVKVVVETTPWGDFQTKTFREFAAKGDSWDIVVGDSQWLGAGSTQGHYVELTDWFIKKGVDKSMAPATVVGYAEYPKGGKRYWAVPLEGDANGWAYRKDWFEDPNEKAAFKKKYGYELAVPETWAQLRDIAEFFYRPDKGRYGVAIYTQKDYDAITMGVENVLWAWGADLGDYQTYKVDGILNSPDGVASLEFYRELYKFTPPDWGNAFFQENNQAITEGLAAMSMNYFAFFPALVNPAANKYAKDTGFFSMPAGPKSRVAALGGQGASIVSYSKKRDLAFQFLEWFIRDEVQKKWAELGGYTCNANVLKSEAFLGDTPYNRAFFETMFMVKDFWAVPEYAELLEVSQRNWNQYVVGGEGTAKGAMDTIARDWETIFKKYGRLK
ncbi:MAG: extracellular solute-binding protein [candidate division Zixibacteria bacterium]|nr:extracellular solute-binding protein [candidate division Zixibacteria bacterium]